MKKSAKKWLIAAGILTAVGAVMFAAAMTAYHWDFSRLSTDRLETNSYEIKEEFTNIQLNTGTADILFSASDDKVCRVVCYERENEKHSVSVQNDTLTVSAADDRAWYEHIGISFRSPKVTVYLPKAEYRSLGVAGSTGEVEVPEEFRFDSADISLSTGDVSLSAAVSGTVRINTSTGDIRVENTSAGALDLSVSTGGIIVSEVTCSGDMKASVTTGDVKVRNVACRNLISSGDTGDISLTEVTAAEEFSIGRSTGDVVFERSDAAGIAVKTSTGSVTGTLLSEKIFITESSTGRISVPGTTTGGTCEIRTTTGDIEIGIS